MKNDRKWLVVFSLLCIGCLVLSIAGFPTSVTGTRGHMLKIIVSLIMSVTALVNAGLSYRYARRSGRSAGIWALGALLLPFLVPIVLALRSDTRGGGEASAAPPKQPPLVAPVPATHAPNRYASGKDKATKVHSRKIDTSARKDDSDGIKALIKNLSLKPLDEVSFIHPQKEEAMEALKRYGRAALQPLLQAIEKSNEEARGTIIYLLSCIENNNAAILPIAKRLQDHSAKVRIEAIGALERSAPKDINDPEVVDYLKRAANDDGIIEVREKAKDILAKIEIQTAEAPWHTGANTWKEISDAFVELEIRKPIPDFKGLGQKLQAFSAGEKHGAWAYIAGKMDRLDKMKSMRCYIEALYNDPDPNSVAWDWLNGHYDKEMNILSPRSPKTRAIGEKLRHKYGPITDESDFNPRIEQEEKQDRIRG